MDLFALAPLGLALLVVVFVTLVNYRDSIDKPIEPNDAFAFTILVAEGLLVIGAIISLLVRSGLRRGATKPTYLAFWLIAVPATLIGFAAAVTSLWAGVSDAIRSQDNAPSVDLTLGVSGIWFGVASVWIAVTATRAFGAVASIARWRASAPALAESCDYVLGPGSRSLKLRPPGSAALALAAGGWALCALAVVLFYVLGVAEAIAQSNALLGTSPSPFFDVYSFLWSLSPVGSALTPFFAFFAIGFVAQALLARAARMRAPLALAAREVDPRPPVLVLRSFQAEHLALDRMIEVSTAIGQLRATRQRTLEETVVDASSKFGPAVAIGRPGEVLPPLGAARLYVGESGDWQAQVKQWIEESAMVVAMLGGSEGLHWEFRAVRDAGMARKLLVICPPSSRDELALDWSKVASQLVDVPPGDGAARYLRRREPWPLSAVGFATQKAVVFTSSARNEAAYAVATRVAAAYLANPDGVEAQLRSVWETSSIV